MDAHKIILGFFYNLNLCKSLKMSTLKNVRRALYVSHKKLGLSKEKKFNFFADGFVCLFVMFRPSELSARDAQRNVDKTTKRTHLNCNKA